MGFSRQEDWSGLPFPSPGNLSDPGNEPESPTWKADGNTIQRLSSLFKVTPLIIGGGGDQAHVILTLKAFYSLLFARGGHHFIIAKGYRDGKLMPLNYGVGEDS